MIPHSFYPHKSPIGKNLLEFKEKECTGGGGVMAVPFWFSFPELVVVVIVGTSFGHAVIVAVVLIATGLDCLRPCGGQKMTTNSTFLEANVHAVHHILQFWSIRAASLVRDLVLNSLLRSRLPCQFHASSLWGTSSKPGTVVVDIVSVVWRWYQ